MINDLLKKCDFPTGANLNGEVIIDNLLTKYKDNIRMGFDLNKSINNILIQSYKGLPKYNKAV
jgi:hypothetical protein